MGQRSVTDVVNLLKGAGYRCQRGYPGGRMPDLQGSAVAVNIHSQDESSICMAVWVLNRADRGAAACEDLAQNVAGFLRKNGARCHMDSCIHDGRADRFAVRLLASWQDDPVINLPDISIEGKQLSHAIGFSCRQETEFTGAVGSPAPSPVQRKKGPWIFTVEEQFPPNFQEPAAPPEPFTLVLWRPGIGDTFDGCYWKSVLREETATGVHQIRVGVSDTRHLEPYQ